MVQKDSYLFVPMIHQTASAMVYYWDLEKDDPSVPCLLGSKLVESLETTCETGLSLIIIMPYTITASKTFVGVDLCMDTL